jgi:excisionase family DNA binding protein
MAGKKHLDRVPSLPEVPLQLDCLYTPEEAAPYLRMTERMVYRRLDSKALGCTRIGQTRFIRGTQILAFMDENAEDPRPPHLRPRLHEV